MNNYEYGVAWYVYIIYWGCEEIIDSIAETKNKFVISVYTVPSTHDYVLIKLSQIIEQYFIF